mmetsp:Transcript_21099/g.48431  ORF Transcript_21099/g.48431 Transcript_21099/m.48431 type:complete len:206 (-) Transcript_21099:56-673(-)
MDAKRSEPHSIKPCIARELKDIAPCDPPHFDYVTPTRECFCIAGCPAYRGKVTATCFSKAILVTSSRLYGMSCLVLAIGQAITPSTDILEQLQPWRCLETACALHPILWGVWPLPWPNCQALWMRHHRQASAICTAQPNDTLWRSIGIVRVAFGGLAIIIYVSEGHQCLLLYRVMNFWVGEVASTLTMCDPHTKLCALHATHPDI